MEKRRTALALGVRTRLRRLRLAGLALLWAFAGAAWVAAAPADIARGLAWLQAQVTADGTLLGESQRAAAEQAQCETAATLQKLSGGNAQIAALLSALQTQVTADSATETLACVQRLRVQLGQAVLSADLEARHLAGQGYAAQLELGVPTSLDTGRALAAQLALLGASDKTAVLAWLQSTQASDGSFGVAGRADLAATAAVLRGLYDLASTNPTAASIATRASGWLLSQRNAQQVWAGDVATTAVIYEAVHPYTGIESTLASVIEGFLLGAQQADGSWSGDAYITAVALRALALTSVTPVDPTLAATATIRGTVSFAANGTPAAGVTVQAQTAGAAAKSATTDAQGKYLLQGVTPGTITVSATFAGYQTASAQVSLQAGGAANFSPALVATGASVPNTARLTGKVLAWSSNAPVAGATVKAVGATTASGTTDAQGAFDLTVPAGTYAVTYTATGYVPLTQQFLLSGGAVADAGAVVLQPERTSSTLRGTVIDLGGQPVSGATVSVQGGGPTTITNASGAYSLSGISNLQFSVNVSAGGYLTRSVTLTTPYPTDLVQDFTLPGADSAYLTIGQLSLTPSSVGLRQDLIASATINNPASGSSSALSTAQVIDAQGVVVATLTAQDQSGNSLGVMSLNPGEQQAVRYKWNSGTFSPGSYLIRARLQVPGTPTRDNPDGVVFATQQANFSVTGGASFFGSVTANPPVLRAGTNTAVKLSALIQNDGNVALPAQDYKLSVVNTATGQTVASQSVSSDALPVQQLRALIFADWTPTNGGNFRLDLTAPATPGPVVSTTLYVGDSGSATFSVDRNVVPSGTQSVKGTITVTGQSVVNGTINDPLVPLVKNAITNAVKYADNYAYNHYVNDLKCYACHVQTQAVVGGERNLKYVQPLQPLQRNNLLNGVMQNIRSNYGFILHDAGLQITNTSLGLWAGVQWHDPKVVVNSNRRMAEFLMGIQRADGGWSVDHDATWWRTSSALVALNVGSLSSMKQQVPTAGAGSGISLVPVTIANLPAGGMRFALDKGGNLYIAHFSAQKLYVVAAGTNSAVLLESLPINSVVPLEDGRLVIGSRNGIYVRGASGGLTRLNTLDTWDVISDGAGQFLVSPYGGSAIYRMSPSGALTQVFASSLLQGSSGSLVLKPDGSVVTHAYWGYRLLRFKTDGQLVEIPAPVTNGNPLDSRSYKDGHLLSTETGLYYYNKDWVVERLLSDGTAGTIELPDGRLLVNTRAGGLYEIKLGQRPLSYRVLANDGGTFTLSSTSTVAYGANAKFFEKTLAPGTYGCNTGVFGNPSSGGANTCWTMALPDAQDDATSFTSRVDATVAKSENWLVAGSGVSTTNNIDIAFRLIGLGKLKEYYKGTAKETSRDALMQSIAATLTARQRSSGGWVWREGTDTKVDPMVTAIVGIALDYLNPSKDSAQVRNAIQYLLGAQQADGTWRSVVPGGNSGEGGLASGALLPSTWVEIWLPTMLERLGGIDTTLNVGLAPNVSIANSSPTPTTVVTSGDGSTSYSWKLLGVTETSQQVKFDLTLRDMLVDEVRPVAKAASLEFGNTFTGGTVSAPIGVPSVAVTTSLAETVATNRPSYADTELATFTATVSNVGSAARTAQVQFTVLDMTGQPVQVLPLPAPVSVAAGASAQSIVTWPVGGVLAGNYQVKADLVSPAGVAYASATAPFAVTSAAGQADDAKVITDRASYTAAQDVQLTSRVANLTSNAMQDNLQAVTTVTTSGGQSVFTRTEPIAQLAAGGQRQYAYSLAASGLAPGNYTASIRLLTGTGSLLAQSSVTFSVLSADQTGVGLTGQLQAPPSVIVGQPLPVVFTATNGSTADLSNVPVTLRVIDPQSGAVLATTSQTLPAWPQGSTQSVNWGWPASGANGQALIVAATATVGGREVPLAQTNVRVLVLTGTLRAEPSVVTVGQQASLVYTLGNPSASAVNAAPADLSIFDAGNTRIGGAPLSVNLPAGGSLAGNVPFTPNVTPQVLRATLGQVVGNTSVPLATTTFEVVPIPVKFTSGGQRKSEGRVLVLASCPASESVLDIDDPYPSVDLIDQGAAHPDIAGCAARRGAAIAAYLDKLGIASKVVTTASQFQEELRCGIYNTYWISGGAAKLDRWLVREVREAVYRGEGLIVDGEHDSRNQLLHPVTGVKYRGKLPYENQQATVDAGSMYAAGPWSTMGQISRFDLLTGQAQAMFPQVPGNQAPIPAVVANRYGSGNSMLFAFNLAAMLAADPDATDARLRDAVLASVQRVASDAATVTTGDAILYSMTLGNQGTRPVSARVVAAVPAGLAFAGSNIVPSNVEASVASTTVTWNITVPAEGALDLTLRLRADQVGSYTVPVTLYSVFDTAGGQQTVESDKTSLSASVSPASGLIAAPSAAVQAVAAATNSDIAAKSRAAKAVADAQAAYAQGQYQAALNSWESAADALITVTSADVSAARTSVAWGLEATQDSLCQTMSCITGGLTVAGSTPLGDAFPVTGVVGNVCAAPVTGVNLVAVITNRTTGDTSLTSQSTLDLAATQTRSAQFTWQPLQGQTQQGDWLDTVVIAQWQGQPRQLGAGATQVTAQTTMCHPGWTLPIDRFTSFGATEGLQAKGGKTSGGDWQFAIGTLGQSRTNLAWVSGKNYGWTFTINAAGQGTVVVYDGATQVAQATYGVSPKMKLGPALRFGLTSASDVGSSIISGGVTTINGQPATLSLASTAPGQSLAAAVYQPATSQGVTASGWVRMDFTGTRTSDGLRMSVQSGQATCQ